jgi:hypothetical protein
LFGKGSRHKNKESDAEITPRAPLVRPALLFNVVSPRSPDPILPAHATRPEMSSPNYFFTDNERDPILDFLARECRPEHPARIFRL